jgi:hypothetical protein
MIRLSAATQCAFPFLPFPTYSYDLIYRCKAQDLVNYRRHRPSSRSTLCMQVRVARVTWCKVTVRIRGD